MEWIELAKKKIEKAHPARQIDKMRWVEMGWDGLGWERRKRKLTLLARLIQSNTCSSPV